MWLAATLLGRAPTAESAAALAKKERAAKRQRAIEALQAELRVLLTTRDFDLEADASIDALFKALDRALPVQRVDHLVYYRELPPLPEETQAEDDARASSSRRLSQAFAHDGI